MYAYLDNAYRYYKESLINHARLALVDDARVRAWIAEQHRLFDRCTQRRFDMGDGLVVESSDLVSPHIDSHVPALREIADRDLRDEKPRNATESAIFKELEDMRKSILTIRDFYDGLQGLIDITLEQDSVKCEGFRAVVRGIMIDMMQIVADQTTCQCEIKLQGIS